MKAVASIEQALLEIFSDLDREDFDRVAARLDADVELADELTGEWLRGRKRVAAYLRASKGIITDIRSRISAVSTRWLTDEIGLATFSARQRYSLDVIPHEETLTGTALFTFRAPATPLVLLLHLGTAAPPHDGDSYLEDEDRTAGQYVAAAETLGERLRRERTEAHLSLRALAKKAGLSASFLSQVERGLVDPSVSSLRRMAEGLGISIYRLVDGNVAGDRLESRIVKASSRRRVQLPDSGLVCEFLIPDVLRPIEAWVGTLAPGALAASVARGHVGDELLLVLEGSMLLDYGGGEHVLLAGDSVYVKSGEPHRFRAAEGRELRFLSVHSLRP